MYGGLECDLNTTHSRGADQVTKGSFSVILCAKFLRLCPVWVGTSENHIS